MSSKIIIGDIHGCFDTLIALVAKFPKDIEIIVCGDLVDRGPKSKEVIQWCIDNNIKSVMGNHEKLMINFFTRDGYRDYDGWFAYNGGYTTLKSYGLDASRNAHDLSNYIDKMKDDDLDILIQHIEWMQKLPAYIEFPDITNSDGRKLVVSHSAVNKMWKHRNDVDLDKELFDEYITWNRDVVKGTLKQNKDIFNVFGHSPLSTKPIIKEHFALIDTGCPYERFGILTALQYPEMIIYQQDNIDKGDENV